MRTLNIGTKRFTKVTVLDEPGAGGACHKYEINCLKDLNGTCATINFQNGPVKENGINGCHQEDLLAIVIDRLRGFQSGKFACRENAIALTHIETSLLWLNKRTADRVDRGVEGTNQV